MRADVCNGIFVRSIPPFTYITFNEPTVEKIIIPKINRIFPHLDQSWRVHIHNVQCAPLIVNSNKKCVGVGVCVQFTIFEREERMKMLLCIVIQDTTTKSSVRH